MKVLQLLAHSGQSLGSMLTPMSAWFLGGRALVSLTTDVVVGTSPSTAAAEAKPAKRARHQAAGKGRSAHYSRLSAKVRTEIDQAVRTLKKEGQAVTAQIVVALVKLRRAAEALLLEAKSLQRRYAQQCALRALAALRRGDLRGGLVASFLAWGTANLGAK